MSRWELSVMNLVPDEELLEEIDGDIGFLTTHALFEHHYFKNDGFIDGKAVLARAGAKLAGKPVHIVQGRYDLVCPPVTAFRLHDAIPHSTLVMTPTSGHSGKTQETLEALVGAAKKLT